VAFFTRGDGEVAEIDALYLCPLFFSSFESLF
jgi:hypothetical protein